MAGLFRLLLAFALSLPGLAASRGLAEEPSAGRLAAQLLVASPDIGDPRFARSVIYIVAHGADGAMGLIVNAPVRQLTFSELFRLLHLEAATGAGGLLVHYGGPVRPHLGLVLHSRDVSLGDADIVAGDLALTSEPEMLRRIAVGEAPARFLFALGYAGWAPNQLETEIGRGDWFVIPADLSLIFTDHPEESWKRAMSQRSTTL